jgi:hypothetical protein
LFLTNLIWVVNNALESLAYAAVTAVGSQFDIHDFSHMLQIHSDMNSYAKISGNYIIYLKEQVKSHEKKGDDKNIIK